MMVQSCGWTQDHAAPDKVSSKRRSTDSSNMPRRCLVELARRNNPAVAIGRKSNTESAQEIPLELRAKTRAHKWKTEERDLLASLEALNLFRVVQPVSMLLALLRVYFAKGLTTRQIRSVLTTMADFHVQFTAVTAQRT
ncbi:MAG: hypothetical protein ACYSUI_25525, partial [Planctomycetota bacterium]